jgi:dihydrofolate reductase
MARPWFAHGRDEQDLLLPDGMVLVRRMQQALSMAGDAGYSRLYGIGGRSIYDEMMPLSDRMVITQVPDTVEDADTFFPPVDDDLW